MARNRFLARDKPGGPTCPFGSIGWMDGQYSVVDEGDRRTGLERSCDIPEWRKVERDGCRRRPDRHLFDYIRR